ncbi:hypothetical protein MNBD_ACTINO01-794 [hydrothermal vent metagenome]|uniref:Uncharacterized protein n=1 Tax=hydrothermal vent metagenome TaxID=652676 RepID=A0A3B0TFQ3_9ZZZZ
METPRARDTDWVVPAIVAGVAVILIVVMGVVAYALSSAEEDTVARELETWSRCLRSEGAPVPLVESLRDGGFRITFDATVLEGVPDIASVGTAFDACGDDAPDAIAEFVDLLDMFGGFPLGGDVFGLPPGDDFFGFEHGLSDGGGDHFGRVAPGVSDLDELMLDELCGRVVERLENGLAVPPRLRRVCDVSG